MAIKKYTSGVWVPITYHKYGTETETITSLPAQIIGDGQQITSCQISGNTVQNGTSTPEAPVDVVGCGVRTGNLFEITDDIKTSTKWELSPTLNEGKRYFEVYDITNAVPRGIISANVFENFEPGYEPGMLVCAITPENTAAVGQEYRILNNNGVITPKTFDTTSWNNVYLCIGYGNSFYHESEKQQKIDELFNNWRIMLNLGSTALQYEPYGYKLSLTCGGTEYPIYLSQVETTRRIKKFVLTGEENWVIVSGRLCVLRPANCMQYSAIVSTHFIQTQRATNPGEMYVGGSYINFNYDGVNDNVPDFKSYLAAQYANGTPVTVWYVLATLETAIVNEPLMKISDYVDTVSATNIPTTGTPENFDVGTTLKPSEVQLTYHGWHEHEDTKYTQGG